MDSVGQVYPRSLDHDVVSALVQLGAGPSSLAHTVRLMAGHELVTEGFAPGQVGSSAMPHKMNTRSCERVNGLQVILRGYASMAAELAGAQWNEGDVFCSVVRRVALPDAFFAIDGQIETFLTVLDEFGAYPAVIQRELDRYLPFLATTRILIAAVRAGVGRETAHEVIKEHAVAVALAMREQGAGAEPVGPLAADPRLPLDRAALDAALADRAAFTGAAGDQVDAVVAAVAELVGRVSGGRQVHAGRHPLIGMSDLTDLDNFAAGFPHELFDRHRREAPVYWHEPTENTPDDEGFWSVATYAETLAVLRDPILYSSVTGGSRPFGGTLLQDISIAGQVLNMMDDPRHARHPPAGQFGAHPADDRPRRGRPARAGAAVARRRGVGRASSISWWTWPPNCPCR